MSWQTLVSHASTLLDAAVILLLAAVLVRLRRDPADAWSAYEARLRELQENLRLLVAQAQGEARELDQRLAAHAERLRAADEPPPARRAAPARAAEAYAAAPPRTPAATPTRSVAGTPARTPSPTHAARAASLPDHVRELVAAGLPIGEIARRLAMPVAEARILAGLSVGGAAAHPALEPGLRTARPLAGGASS